MLPLEGNRNMLSLLSVKGLRKWFPLRTGIFEKKRFVRAIDCIDFDINKGEVLALVGESGCGKTTVGRTILRLIEPDSGSIVFEDEDILKVDRTQLRILRKRMQIIFQDPFASLNPRKRIIDTVGEPLIIHNIAKGNQLKERVVMLLERVGLSAEALYRYPHEFSGGQRQRIGIARAIAVEPSFIVADEPLSALDVSIQAQILNLLQDIKESSGLSFLFISHDLRVVRHFSNRVAVMYLGSIVELVDSEEFFANPLHPYSRALISAVPEPVPQKKKERIVLEGDVPSATDMPAGCRFHTRCPRRFEPCDKTEPAMIEEGRGHKVACHLYGKQ
ncbi:MAG: oligopeptide/dipeptide ABC transporter ATP-binding protein [Nitrospirota bacterium]